MKKRLFKNYATTLLGVIALGVAVYMYLHPDTFNKREAAEVGAIAFLFLRSKDSLIGLKAK